MTERRAREKKKYSYRQKTEYIKYVQNKTEEIFQCYDAQIRSQIQRVSIMTSYMFTNLSR